MKKLAFMLIAWAWFDYTEFVTGFLVKGRIYDVFFKKLQLEELNLEHLP